MTVLLDTRSMKALQIAAGARHWMRLPSGAFSIPSQGNPGQLYVASPTTCQCEDFQRNPARLCKHAIACAIIVALTETQPEPAPVPMTNAEMARIMGRPLVKRLPVTTRED